MGRREHARARPQSELELTQSWLGAAAGKWALPILDCLAESQQRYNALLERLEPVSAKVLTQTLRRLEAERLIFAKPVGRFGRCYGLTPSGRALRDALVELRRITQEVAAIYAIPADSLVRGARSA